MDRCELRGVRTHNLKGIDLSIPFGALTVISGVSGSGKSSLAFDTIYAEGQRRFVDCMATYARQFLERLERPDAEFIGRLEPPLALRQAVAVRNARSTVGTMCEVADLLPLLLAHAGDARCQSCGAPMRELTLDGAIDAIRREREEHGAERIAIAAPVARDSLGGDGVAGLLRQGYTRTIHDGSLVDWPQEWLAAGAPDSVQVVVDRLSTGAIRRQRLAESMEAATRLGGGEARLFALPAASGEPARPFLDYREGLACAACGTRRERPTAALFSANSALGACPECQGFGRAITIDRDKVVPDRRRTLRNDAIVPFRLPSRRGWYRRMLRTSVDAQVRTEVPFSQLTQREVEWIFGGGKGFPGVEGLFRKLERKRYKMHVRILLARFRGYVPCPSCRGTRLRPEALAVTIDGRNLADLTEMPIETLERFFAGLRLEKGREAKVRPVLSEIRDRLRCLVEVGLGYLTLGRSARTLSGGETQRLRLAAGMGASLTRTLYILDEPTVGLHARDASRVLGVLRRICRSGNTVVVVEHDPAIVEGADHLIVLGPAGGERGGELLYEGPPASFLRERPGYFRALEGPGQQDRPLPSGPALHLESLHANNLRIESLDLPLEGIVAISGVSGSGKSTLLDEVIYRNWRRHRGLAVEDVGAAGRISGFETLEEVLLIGQEPLGRSTRSNAISFVKVLPLLRARLAGSPAARALGLTPRHFSFNVPGGRCEVCKGLGTVILEMHFLPDVEVACEACKGTRFRADVLEVAFRGRNIQSILEMTADEAAIGFGDLHEIVRRLQPLQDVGLGYLRLGQPTSTLSGGEAQRLKLASFLAEDGKGGAQERRLFLFDEPTTGLHAQDIAKLLGALRLLVGRGHGVIVVEHHLDFLAQVDWVIDLGPGAGEDGGRVVYEGPVEGLLRRRGSITGRALAAHLSPARRARSAGAIRTARRDARPGARQR